MTRLAGNCFECDNCHAIERGRVESDRLLYPYAWVSVPLPDECFKHYCSADCFSLSKGVDQRKAYKAPRRGGQLAGVKRGA